MKELLIWSGMIVLFWLLIGWCKWKLWEWQRDRAES